MCQNLDALVEQIHQGMLEAVRLRREREGRDSFLGHDLGDDYLDQLASPSDDVCVNAHIPAFDDLYVIHRNAFYEIIYVHRGSLRLEISNLFYQLAEGDVALVNYNVPHAVMIMAPGSRVLNVLFRRRLLGTPFFDVLMRNPLVSSAVVPALLQNVEARPFVIFRQARQKSDDLRPDLECLLRSCVEARTMRSDEQALRLSLLLIDLTRAYEEEAVEDGGHREDLRLVDVIRYILERLSTATLGDVAEEFHYTPRHFSKMIRSQYGKSFSGLLQDLRVHEAKQLLRTSEMPIGEIAEQVGTSNRAHFYRIFRDRTGIGPKEYRDRFRRRGGSVEPNA